MSERLPDELRDLIARERATSSLDGDAAARIAEKLSSSLALPVVPPDPSTLGGEVLSTTTTAATTATATTATVATATWTAAKLAPIALAFMIGGVSGSSITARVLKDQAASVIEPRSVAPSPLPSPTPAPALIPAPIPQPTAGMAGPGHEPPVISAPLNKESAPQPTPNPNATDRDLRAERELLELARRALGQGHIEDALVALDKHHRRFAKGRLAEERDSLRVPALVMLGKLDEATRRAEQFQKRYPNSLFLPVVQNAIQSAAPAPNP